MKEAVYRLARHDLNPLFTNLSPISHPAGDMPGYLPTTPLLNCSLAHLSQFGRTPRWIRSLLLKLRSWSKPGRHSRPVGMRTTLQPYTLREEVCRMVKESATWTSM